MDRDIQKLRHLSSFDALVDYLRDELDWPIEVEDAEDLVFDYDPLELGLDPQHAVKVENLKQVRPLTDNQPWGIFYLEFEAKRLPVVVLRRILHALIPRSRSRNVNQPVWQMEDLLFISTFGTGMREIAFAHFHQGRGDLPTLRVLGWDGADTPLKLDHVAATLKTQLRWPSDGDDAETWRTQWAGAFRHRVRHVIRTANALAERLALLARGIRDAASTLIAHESDHGPLRRLHKAFQTALIHDLSEDDFADTYAQTVTYGLLTAAISRTDMDGGRYGTALVAQNVADMVPITNPFLRDMLQTFLRAGGQPGGIDFDELGIQDVVDLLRGDKTDLPAVLRDFGNRTRGEDPVIHFYEHFLAAYDKQLKVQRGIFYTPQPVVSFIVRSVHELLKTEFGLEDGLASTITWGEMAARHPDMKIPEGTDPDEPFVVILDPATGTATFLVEVIDVIYRTLTEKWQSQGLSTVQQREMWNKYVPQHLLPRLYGYELMMAPYAIAHMKLGLKLHETGYRFGSDARVRVYLTNALEPASDDDRQLAFDHMFPALAHEARAVDEVKRQVSPTFVIGNPPYAGHSANDSQWVAGLLRGVDKTGQSVQNYFEVDGHSLNERNPKWLNDDYVKFIRFGQWRIAKTGVGVLAYITNHGYLDNPTFRGMRQSLMDDFDLIYILDLHGNSLKKETTPEGNPDENVFDIMPGVAVTIVVKEEGDRPKKTEIYHTDLWGFRGEKYATLLKTSIQNTVWDRLWPAKPFYLLTKQDIALRGEYLGGWKISEIYPVNAVGIVTARDRLTIHWTPEQIWETVTDFSKVGDEEARAKYHLGKDVQDWKVQFAKIDLNRNGLDRNKIVPILYRPNDIRYTYYTGKSRGFICRPRSEVMRHLLNGKNLALITNRQVKGSFRHCFASRHIIDFHVLETAHAAPYVFPIYINTTQEVIEGGQSRFSEYSSYKPNNNIYVPNLSAKFINDLQQSIKLKYIPERLNNVSISINPEDVFHYIYAVFHSPTYRTRYAEFLKIDFPRLPLTKDVGLFRVLCALGADLVALHLLEDDYAWASWNQEGDHTGSPLQHPITTFVEGNNGTMMGSFSKRSCYQDGRVYLDTSNIKRSSYFDGVPEDVWQFHIGGYQVLYKWLYDRRGKKGEPGRTLTPEDITHYQRIVVALKETIRLMGEIDAVIDVHGGWPIE